MIRITAEPTALIAHYQLIVMNTLHPQATGEQLLHKHSLTVCNLPQVSDKSVASLLGNYSPWMEMVNSLHQFSKTPFIEPIGCLWPPVPVYIPFFIVFSIFAFHGQNVHTFQIQTTFSHIIILFHLVSLIIVNWLHP